MSTYAGLDPDGGMLAPVGDADAVALWSALDDGVLLVSVCGACGKRWLPPLATTLVLVSTLKVQSFPALSVMVRLSAATVLTVPLVVIVLSAAWSGAATRPSTTRAAAKRNIRCLPEGYKRVTLILVLLAE